VAVDVAARTLCAAAIALRGPGAFALDRLLFPSGYFSPERETELRHESFRPSDHQHEKERAARAAPQQRSRSSGRSCILAIVIIVAIALANRVPTNGHRRPERFAQASKVGPAAPDFSVSTTSGPLRALERPAASPRFSKSSRRGARTASAKSKCSTRSTTQYKAR
jgi:hypothetical protein